MTVAKFFLVWLAAVKLQYWFSMQIFEIWIVYLSESTPNLRGDRCVLTATTVNFDIIVVESVKKSGV